MTSLARKIDPDLALQAQAVAGDEEATREATIANLMAFAEHLEHGLAHLTQAVIQLNQRVSALEAAASRKRTILDAQGQRVN